MTDIERVKAEIERRLHTADYSLDTKPELQSLLSFIDSLQDEPGDEELFKEAGYKSSEEYVEKYMKLVRKKLGDSKVVENDHLEEDLEKAIDRYECLVGGFESMSNHDCRQIARYFADWGSRWQKQQMMNGAKTGEVRGIYDDIVTVNVIYGKLNTPLYLRRRNYKNLKRGDKVKLIILPSDEADSN